MSEEAAPGEADIRRAFKTRAMSAWEAYLCCKGGRLRAAKFILELTDHVQELWQKFGPELRTAAPLTLPRLAPTTRIETFSPGLQSVRPIMGSIQLNVGGERATMEWLESDAEMQAIRKFVNFATDTLSKNQTDCYRCVQRKSWPQSKARQSVTVKEGGKVTQRLHLRVPHK